ncbi:MAG TPA: hypothetical protein ENO22_10105 [candidate division Zixibacteria bacterium]|nr:hypothetical protein [candidate division Zixibacteria bacterium]HEQ99680.1 hypothetical protein [candidate division Zixibacteria bacterium]
MQDRNQEYRQAVLMAAIVAVVPLIFYPRSLGLALSISPLLFLLIELVFYWIIFSAFLKGATFNNIFISGTICLFSRLVTGAVFALLVVLMYAAPPAEAFAAGIFKYKPAMLLQVISFPFILMPALKRLLDLQTEPKTQAVFQTADQISAEPPPQKPKAAADDMKDRKIIGLKSAAAEKPFSGFDEALKYVGETSAVRFAVLIDSRGLPVSFFGNNKSLRDLWSAVGKFLVDELDEPLRRAGDFEFEGFELTLNTYRIHVVKAEELYLFVAADKESGETEKVRVSQAANMVRRIYQERYSIKPDINAREESYVRSFS